MAMEKLVIITVLYLIGVVAFFAWQTDFPASKEKYMQDAREVNKEIGSPLSDKALMIGGFVLVGLCSFGWPIGVFVMPFMKAPKE